MIPQGAQTEPLRLEHVRFLRRFPPSRQTTCRSSFARPSQPQAPSPMLPAGSLFPPDHSSRRVTLPCAADCSRLHLLHAVWSATGQTTGLKQGLYFNPSNGTPRVGSRAFSYSLEILLQLAQKAAPLGSAGPDGSCGSTPGIASWGFSSGACAVTLASMAQVQVRVPLGGLAARSPDLGGTRVRVAATGRVARIGEDVRRSKRVGESSDRANGGLRLVGRGVAAR
jgi:hypothetical protein